MIPLQETDLHYRTPVTSDEHAIYGVNGASIFVDGEWRWLLFL